VVLCQVKAEIVNLLVMKGIVLHDDTTKHDLDTNVVMNTRANETTTMKV
jgi:hypothetical protein